MNDFKQELIRYPAARITEVAKALSGDLRVRILETLGDMPMGVSQLAEALGVAQPTMTINIQILEQAGLVVSSPGANREKICYVTCKSILLELPVKTGDGLHRIEQIHMPIGMYSRSIVRPTCGMAGHDGVLIGSIDDPRAFYMPERTDASLLWFSGAGCLEYLFANPIPPGVPLDELRLTAELCSEAPSFDMNRQSDISLYMNDMPVGTWRSPGDFGDRKGKLTPDRWFSGTEYGALTEWKVTKDGGYVNGIRATGTTLGDLSLDYSEPIRVRLEVGKEAEFQGGLNLLGSGFGDHPQDIVMSFVRSIDRQ
ncbi:ArsR family transcriptional regulator [Paenibacillus hemerocallicola]|uniref:ArsR family transcriptional regulator n=1 Tax=Paenibacillus hemerocallicola TaxID=1172614 RepID=A0A5C4T724_9BACL|nr:helix-turn-helix domain-containing protein [Paenibacillus hemerocallicola]TNJ64791.1 ArsR family transcriptional regulator [Paenibacillus hemerocallicola]